MLSTRAARSPNSWVVGDPGVVVETVGSAASASVPAAAAAAGTVRLLIAFTGPVISSVWSVGDTGFVDVATSAGAGPAGGRAIPPVGSFGARIAVGSSKMLVARMGMGAGLGSLSAARTRARPNCDALNRSAASGRPARSSTAASGPRSADSRINLPIRAFSVATVESASNGTLPDTASTRINANEYTSERPSSGLPSACSGEA